MSTRERPGEVAIILPTYNRAKLLPKSLDSVLAQLFRHWELIVVDDNSVDETPSVIEAYSRRDRRIRSVRNDRYEHSCAGARRRGLDEIRGKYVAFIDSDDRWPNYHLSDLVELLDMHDDVDWIFGDLQRVTADGRTLVASKFEAECPWRTDMTIEARGPLRILRPEGLLEIALRTGFNPGLQTSLLRRKVFDRLTIRPSICEDRLLALEAIVAGFKIGYVLDNHLLYLVHEDNVSGARINAGFERQLKIATGVERFWATEIPENLALTPSARAIVAAKLAEHRVWFLGGVYREAGRRWNAAWNIWRGLRLRPLNWGYWKALAATVLGIR